MRGSLPGHRLDHMASKSCHGGCLSRSFLRATSNGCPRAGIACGDVSACTSCQSAPPPPTLRYANSRSHQDETPKLHDALCVRVDYKFQDPVLGGEGVGPVCKAQKAQAERLTVTVNLIDGAIDTRPGFRNDLEWGELRLPRGSPPSPQTPCQV